MASDKHVLLFEREKTLKEIQKQFSSVFPLLKIEFYKTPHFLGDKDVSKNIFPGSASLASLGFGPKAIAIEFSDILTVKTLERTILQKTGFHAQVFRKSGKVWLETSATDNWTLREQNDEAESLQQHLKQQPENPADFDYD